MCKVDGNSSLDFYEKLKACGARKPTRRAPPHSPPRPRNGPLSADHRALLARAYPLIASAVRVNGILCKTAGMDRQDAVQHLALVFVRRLQGPHPYDPSRGSLEAYLKMLTRSVLLNLRAKKIRRHQGDIFFAADHQGKVEEISLESLFPDLNPFANE